MKRINVTHPTLKSVCFGRRRPLPSREAKFKLRFGDYSSPQLPTPPATVDYSGASNAPMQAGLRQIFLNDQLGDCTCAGVGHDQVIFTGNAGNLVVPTNDQVLAIYEAVGGYVPGNPSTDQGCDEEQVLDYLAATGFPDTTKLSSYLAIDSTNQTEVQQAMWMFENLYFGIELPDAWISPFPSADGFVWDVGTPDPDNGHCVVGIGYNAQGVQIDTWGMFGTITWAAVSQLCSGSGGGQLFVLLSPDMIASGQTTAPSGFDWATLQTDLNGLNGRGGMAAGSKTPAK